MERLAHRVAMARAALQSLDELAHKPVRSKIERDAAIQRFEHSFEAVWKAVQHYAREIEGVDVTSPKHAARVSLQLGLLDEPQTRAALTMADDRNLTVHTYNEALALIISERLTLHARLLREWLDHVEAGSKRASAP